MLKMSMEDFIEEIKAEMFGYEEIGEENINKWVDTFKNYVKQKKDKKNRISYKANSVNINLKDESDLFNIVDKYYAAVENDDVDNYFNNFSV